MDEIRIDREALRVMVAHARREFPRECCGLLVGRRDEILEAVPTSNGAADPERGFEISPVDYFSQIRRCRRISEAQAETFEVVGAYHSHPRRDAEPSETDVAHAFADFLFLIVGMGVTGGGMDVRGYTYQPTGFPSPGFTPVTLTVVD